MFNLKDFKIVKTMKNLRPRLKWLMFSQVQDYKIHSNYMDIILNDKEKQVNVDNAKLEQMVRESLIKEFSPKIKNMKSYNLLVDAVVYNLKRKQLQSQKD